MCADTTYVRNGRVYYGMKQRVQYFLHVLKVIVINFHLIKIIESDRSVFTLRYVLNRLAQFM